MEKLSIINRDLSWLSFNERVLQEAENPAVPLIERLKFLGIYSNNLDEFFRVRVATISRMTDFKKQAKNKMGFNPIKLLDEMQKQILILQERYDKAYADILEDLEKENIHFINEKQLTKQQGNYVRQYFHDKVRLEVFPIIIRNDKPFPVLQDASIYLAVQLYKKIAKTKHRSLIEIPTNSLPRFVEIPSEDDKKYIIFLDDIIRYNLKSIFKLYDFDVIEAYTIKFTRDAELDIDNDVAISFLESVELSLEKRKNADALRFIHDAKMPKEFLNFLIKKMQLDKEVHVVAGTRYHNFKDFIKFPTFEKSHLRYEDLPQIPHADLKNVHSILSKIKEKDILLYYPYHSFDYFLDLLREAAIDPSVSHIRCTLYRIAKNSNVVKSLITAVRNGKDVTVFIELRARFDEEANIEWANILTKEGAKVITGIPDLKVHSKLCLITRRERGQKIYYAAIGTGNFHEKTANIYTDAMLLTSNQLLTKEVRNLFTFLDKNYYAPKFNRLLVAPFNLRTKLEKLINREIKFAKMGLTASITIKINSLTDEDMIRRLYQASKNGVKVKLIVRGICSLIPQLPKLSENIEVISIVDRFLEHTRVFIFHNNNEPEYFIGSADLMARNLDYRVEVITPIIDKKIQQTLANIIDIQWQDNVKARIISGIQTNQFRYIDEKTSIRSQYKIYDYLLGNSKKKIEKKALKK
ncbi:MAG: polyphosphate kinase 1 [Chitinophagales bacterium]|nr:polyphosphate kinase 1 [Chitinophagales bacterium]